MARRPMLSPARRAQAKPALQYAFDELEREADKVPAAAAPPPGGNNLAIVTAMTGYLVRNFPRATPSDDVKREIPTLVADALARGYPVHVPAVQEALVNYALAVRTEGFTNENTTGTLIGNRASGGGLRGMGMSDD